MNEEITKDLEVAENPVPEVTESMEDYAAELEASYKEYDERRNQTYVAEENPDAHKMQNEMEEDLLRRARFLVVCGNRITEDMKDDITIAKKAKLIVTSMEGITGYL